MYMYVQHIHMFIYIPVYYMFKYMHMVMKNGFTDYLCLLHGMYIYYTQIHIFFSFLFHIILFNF